MSFLAFLFQFESVGALAAGVVFFLVFTVVAYIAFRVLKKTVKMALRVTVVMAILLIAVIGSFSLWWFNSSADPKAKTPASRPR